MKYKKKPVIIDAVQWTGKNHREMFDFLTQDTFSAEAMKVTGDHFYIDHSKVEGGLIIKTLEGEHLATIGDYIIRGVKGEYYPCKEDIFHQSYEIYIDFTVKPSIPSWGGVITVPCGTEPEKVPYGSICSCNPANGGSGICGCIMGNQMVPNPKLSGTLDNLSRTTTANTFVVDSDYMKRAGFTNNEEPLTFI
jgi:hypothetical protein